MHRAGFEFEVTPELRRRFFLHLRAENGCLVWTGGRKGPYGSVWVRKGLRLAAHRVAYAIAFGAVPPDSCVCHSCDNPLCVYPGHLWLGDMPANIADRDRKGRTATIANGRRAPGLPHPGWKLDEQRVRSIRRIYAYGTAASIIASSFGISAGLVYDIMAGRTWSRFPFLPGETRAARAARGC